METVCFSKLLAFIYESTWRQNPEDQHLSIMFMLQTSDVEQGDEFSVSKKAGYIRTS
jgi:hypothetical protein